MEWSDSCSVSCHEAYAKGVSICQGLNQDAEKALTELRLCIDERCRDRCEPGKTTVLECTGCTDNACHEARTFCEQN